VTKLIVDGNNVLMSQHNNVYYLDNGMVFNFARQILKQAALVEPEQIIVAWDAGRSWRKGYYPDYKANRVANGTEEWYSQLNQARDQIRAEMLPNMGIDQYIVSGYEADDIAGYLSFTRRHNPTVLYSNDKDWLVLVDDNTSVLYKDRGLDKHVLVTRENFHEITSWRSPEEFLFAKCAMGDKSDNIAGLDRIGPITMRQYFDGDCKGVKGERLKAFFAGSEQFKRNLKLMDIRAAVIDMPIQVFPGHLNREKTLTLFEELKFTTLLSSAGKWMPLLEKLDKCNLIIGQTT
jgi:5'-3' exonuclease